MADPEPASSHAYADAGSAESRLDEVEVRWAL